MLTLRGNSWKLFWQNAPNMRIDRVETCSQVRMGVAHALYKCVCLGIWKSVRLSCKACVRVSARIELRQLESEGNGTFRSS